MNRIFMIFDENDNVVRTYNNKNGKYDSLGAAKTAAKIFIKHINKKLEKQFRIKFEEYKIIEFELIQKVIHPL